MLIAGNLSSCENIGVAKFDDFASIMSSSDESANVDKSINFLGIESVSDKSDTAVTLNWTPHESAISYALFNTVTGKAAFLRPVVGQSTSSLVLTGLTPNTNYKFRLRMINSAGAYDGNTNDIAVTLNLTPNAPSSITLITPSSSPSLVNRPVVRVSGVKNGDIVKLYSDSSCTSQVASDSSTGTTIDLTTNSLSGGSYSFHATATSSSGTASACSVASVAYVRTQCPTGYVSVPFNTEVGTSADFCVAKYEMKKVGDVATSSASELPWVNLSQTEAIAACAGLNATNSVTDKYFLISNPEWMTIARNVEMVGSNWSDGVAGGSVLARGHIDNNPGNSLSVSNISDPYDQTGNTSTGTVADWAQRRMLTLSNGATIWDFSGNVWEWVNWQVTPAKKAYESGSPISVDQSWKDFADLGVNIGSSDEMKPATWQSSFLTARSTQGIGRYNAGIDSSGGATMRGGSWYKDTNAGAFSLDLVNSPSYSAGDLGFRCVYRD